MTPKTPSKPNRRGIRSHQCNDKEDHRRRKDHCVSQREGPMDGIKREHDGAKISHLYIHKNHGQSQKHSRKFEQTLIPHFNLETLHYKIKAGQLVAEWNDLTHNSEDDHGFIKKIYDTIAWCFVCDYKAIKAKRSRMVVCLTDEFCSKRIVIIQN
eukprot:404742_1